MIRKATSRLVWLLLLALLAAATTATAQDAPPAAEPPAQPAAKPEAKPAPKPDAKPDTKADAEPAAAPAPAKPKPPAPAPKNNGGPPGTMTLNFKSASLKEVLSHIAERSNLSIHYQYQVSGDVTVTSPKAVDLEAALEILNAALVAKQAVAVRSGNVLKVVSLGDAKKSNLPIFKGSDPDEVREGEQFITQIIPLKSVQAGQIAKDLANLIPAHAELTSNQSSNSLVYTASATDVKRLLRILYAIDGELSQVAGVKVFRLRNADAKSVEATVKSLFESGASTTGRSRSSRRDFYMRYRMGGGSSSSSGTSGSSSSSGSEATNAYRSVKVSSDERTNSVVVVAAKDKLDLIIALIEELDADPADAIGTVKVFALKNADATALAEVIRELFAGDADQRRRNNAREMYMRMRMGGRGSSTSSTGSRTEDYEEVKVSVDQRTNSMIVVASDEKLALVAQLVEQLDSDSTETESTMTYKCKYANAVTVANVINDLFKQENERSRNARTPTRGLGTTTSRTSSSSSSRTTPNTRR